MRPFFYLRIRPQDKMLCHIITYNVHGLPWCKKWYPEIISWLQSKSVPVLCFQELFTTSGRDMFERGLSKQGYTVLRPHDEDVTLFPSGLLTAINTNEFHILSSCFCSYLTYTNVDRFANKGFFTVHVMDRKTGRKAYIVNTHMQSDWEGSILLGNKITKDVRRKQAEQILEYFQGVSDPVLLVGDLNQEYNPHPYLRFLHPPSKLPIRKATFIQTGEDLDHVAWLPLQWASKEGCGFCDIQSRGPQLRICQVHALPWSDHAAVEVAVEVPTIPTPQSK
jgi:endonuclease/exonuclease/phosphatase family metal-dependent hydrolase